MQNMSSEFSLNVKDIIGRVKKVLNADTDTKLSEILGISQAAISTWKKRGNIDLPLIFAKCKNTSLDWLIYGEGTPDGKPEFDPNDESIRIDQMILETLRGMDTDKKRYIAEYIEREKLFWELKKKVNGIDDYGKMRKAG